MISIEEEKILFPLRGFNKNDDYQKAKRPAIKKWEEFKGLKTDRLDKYLNAGHWLGLAIKNTSVIDMDQVVDKSTGEIVQDGHQVGELLIPLLQSQGYTFHAIRTPNGFQFMFNHTEGLKNNTKQVTPLGIISDYRVKDKGYIVYPTDNTEGRYFEVKAEGPLSSVPAFLKPMKNHHDNVPFLPQYPLIEGSRNDDIYRWLCEVKNFQEPEQVGEIGHAIGAFLCDPPYEDLEELENTIKSAIKQPKRDVSDAPEFGTIEAGEQLGGDKLKKALLKRRFVEYGKLEAKWEASGKQGRKPETITPLSCARVLQEYVNFVLFDLEENTKLAMYMPNEGIYTQNTMLIQRIISWLEPKHNRTKADEVIYHLRNNAEVKEKTNDRYLIPVNNGVFNLKTKLLEDFSPDYVFTTKVSTNYVPDAKPPVLNGWDVESWLKEIACDDEEIVTLLWQVINDALNGNYTRKKAIFLVGDGNNGKGTFQELLTNVIGFNNIATLKANEFDERFRLSVLEGKTAVIGDDVPVSVYIDDSSNFKSVITGDTVSVEFKGRPIYNTAFKCTVIQSTNGMPKFRDKTKGNTRRLLIVPFNAKFDAANEKFDIKEDYIKRPEVLEYVLNKAINLDFERFSEPAASIQALDDFNQDNDPVYEFKKAVFDDWIIPEVPKTLVYAYYKEFCDENGYKPLSVRKFHNELKRHLGGDWRSDTKARVEEETLNRQLGDIKNNRYVDFNFPDPKKSYRTYRADWLNII